MKLTSAQKRLLESDERERELGRAAASGDNEAFVRYLTIRARRGEIPTELVDTLNRVSAFKTNLPKDRKKGETRWHSALTSLWGRTIKSIRSTCFYGLESSIFLPEKDVAETLDSIIMSMGITSPRKNKLVGGNHLKTTLLGLKFRLQDLSGYFNTNPNPELLTELIRRLAIGFETIVFDHVRNVVNQI